MKENDSTLLVQTIEDVLDVEVVGVPRKSWNKQSGECDVQFSEGE